jgi:hypothetical protein
MVLQVLQGHLDLLQIQGPLELKVKQVLKVLWAQLDHKEYQED